MSEITQEESQRIAKAFEDFQAANPSFIFCRKHVNAIGTELERLNSVEMAAGRDFNISKETLETAFSNLVAAGKIEIASVQRNNMEAETSTKQVEPFMAEERNRTPAGWTKYWQDKRKAKEDADLAARRKVAENIFNHTTMINQEEKTPRIPDSVSECDEAERARIFQRYPAESIRNFLQRERAKAGR